MTHVVVTPNQITALRLLEAGWRLVTRDYRGYVLESS
jgi:hypothetical protein